LSFIIASLVFSVLSSWRGDRALVLALTRVITIPSAHPLFLCMLSSKSVMTAHILGVSMAIGDRLLEDGWIGGHPPPAILHSQMPLFTFSIAVRNE